jgi:hypothetical protein
MSSLEIEFHCLCVFVPDPDHGVVHVLMPSTVRDCEGGHEGHGAHPAPPAGAGSGPGGAGGGQPHVHELHVVRIVHENLPEPVPMENWALRLGREGGRIDTSLTPVEPPPDDAQIVDLNAHTGRSLDPALLVEKEDPRIIARVTLREGELVRMHADTEWLLKGVPVRMANRSTWCIPDDAGGLLDWKLLGGTSTARVPLPTFDDLPIEDGVLEEGGVRRVHIFDTTPEGLSVKPPATFLNYAQIREHFRIFLELYGIRPEDDPRGDLLPEHENKMLVNASCPNGKGFAAPAAP